MKFAVVFHSSTTQAMWHHVTQTRLQHRYCYFHWYPPRTTNWSQRPSDQIRTGEVYLEKLQYNQTNVLVAKTQERSSIGDGENHTNLDNHKSIQGSIDEGKQQ